MKVLSNNSIPINSSKNPFLYNPESKIRFNKKSGKVKENFTIHHWV